MTDFHDYLETLMRGGIHEAEQLLSADREDFTFPTARPQWAPARHYDIEHLTIDWKMDLKGKRVDAISKLKIKSIAPELSKVFLHAAELNITGVRDSKGNELEYDLLPDEEAMIFYLSKPLKERKREELTFIYTM